MISARNISVELGRKPILFNVDFEAASGEVTAIVGPNGSGKTTLLRAMTQEVDFTGQVKMNGRDIAMLKPWQLSAIRGVLPQKSALAFPFTVSEVVRIGLSEGVEAQAEDRIVRALDRVGLAHYADRFYQELSGGEQQRVQLARVLAQVWEPVVNSEARWLFLDEPVSALDIGHQLEVMDLAHAYAKAGGGVVAVMHDLNLTSLYAERVVVMSNGQVLAAGRPEAVLTDDILSEAYSCSIAVNRTPLGGGTFLLPHCAGASSR